MAAFWNPTGQEAHGGHTIIGVAVRAYQRLLAMTPVIWHNNQTGHPVKRFRRVDRCGGVVCGRGPFGPPDRVSWFAAVFSALTSTIWGQAALIAASPRVSLALPPGQAVVATESTVVVAIVARLAGESLPRGGHPR
jgi:hypothetical protein